MHVLLDMDGVLVNFVEGLCRALGKTNPYYPELAPGAAGVWNFWTLLGVSVDEFWAPARNTSFWTGLDFMPDGLEILAAVEQAAGPENICLLSCPSGDPAAAAGKVTWIAEHLPQYRRRFLLGPAKEFCAGAESLLIDDRDDNVIAFAKRGGRMILVPRPWNSMHELRETTLQHLRFVLKQQFPVNPYPTCRRCCKKETAAV